MPGQSVTLTVTYSVAPTVDTQLVNNTARVASDEVTTPVTDSDDVQMMENVDADDRQGLFQSGQRSAPATRRKRRRRRGARATTFYIVVTNTGMSTADNVMISDLVPAALTVTNVSGTPGAEVAPTGDNNIQWSMRH